jgi:ABC-type nitrate/sulfonate/bicarbonate transport system substrate-binding protein
MTSPKPLRTPALILLAGFLALVAGCARAVPVPAVPPAVVKSSASGVESANLRKDDVKDLAIGEVLDVPYILWGGDVATFLANGGETTQNGTVFAKYGLKLKLARGDDFAQQVKDYKEGKSPFLRGTMSMLGQVSEDIGGDSRTRPVVFLQLTWSAGDHLVARANSHLINDLKGKKIALQKGGPHVGMLNDILTTARFSWNDINVVWTDDVTGDKGPAELFRKDQTIDGCFAITPDMVGLTGGLEKTGDGKDKTVPGAHVLVSTADMKRSIADVYACRKDFFDAHKDIVEKFAAGYLKGCEDLVAIKKEVKDKPTEKYKTVLALTRQLFGKDVQSDEDADGLISDAVFVGLPGNYSFFKDKGNLSGFDAKEKAALDLAQSLGDAKVKRDLLQADFDYAHLKELGGLSAKVDAPRTSRFADNPKEKNTIYFFYVYFEGGRSDFPEEKYGGDFQRAVEQASLFGNALISVKGHANPQEMNWGFRKEVLKRGLITERGGKFLRKDGSEFPMNDMKAILDCIKAEHLESVRVAVDGPRGTSEMTIQQEIDLLQSLSNDRAKSVRTSVVDYAKRHGYRLDESQMKSAGLGGTEPVIVFPKEHDYQEGGKNRRVEFRIIQVGSEAITPEDFDY